MIASPARAQGCPDADLLPTAHNLDRVGEAARCQLNLERVNAGLEALDVHPRLVISAKFQAQDMARYRYFAHQGEQRPSVLTRFQMSGYFDDARTGFYSENLGLGPFETASARAVVDAWMQSPVHRTNILYPPFRDIGVGLAIAQADAAFYRDRPSVLFATDFGRRFENQATAQPVTPDRKRRRRTRCRPRGRVVKQQAIAPRRWCRSHKRKRQQSRTGRD